MNYRLKYWLSTGRLSVRTFFVRDEVSWGQLVLGSVAKSRDSVKRVVLTSSVAILGSKNSGATGFSQ